MLFPPSKYLHILNVIYLDILGQTSKVECKNIKGRI